MPREGLLLQTDGSRHDWLEGRGPWLALVGYIDLDPCFGAVLRLGLDEAD